MLKTGDCYYIKKINGIINIRHIEDDILILSHLCRYVIDSKTTIWCQIIEKDVFLKYKPLKLDLENLWLYKFLTYYDNRFYRVRNKDDYHYSQNLKYITEYVALEDRDKKEQEIDYKKHLLKYYKKHENI